MLVSRYEMWIYIYTYEWNLENKLLYECKIIVIIMCDEGKRVKKGKEWQDFKRYITEGMYNIPQLYMCVYRHPVLHAVEKPTKAVNNMCAKHMETVHIKRGEGVPKRNSSWN